MRLSGRTLRVHLVADPAVFGIRGEQVVPGSLPVVLRERLVVRGEAVSDAQGRVGVDAGSSKRVHGSSFMR